jgi:hypothetical protein
MTKDRSFLQPFAHIRMEIREKGTRMMVVHLFSKRQKKIRKEVPDVYECAQICSDTFTGCPREAPIKDWV